MSDNGRIADDSTPARPSDPSSRYFGPKSVDVAVPNAGDPGYLAFLHDADPPPTTGRFPLLAFTFMVAMALAVAGLGLGLVLREIGPLDPRETAGAESGDGTAGDDGVPLCDGVTSRQARRIDGALAMMRRTREGDRLIGQLVRHDVCIGVENLEYNAGYASAERSWTGDWGDSTIVIDADLLAAAGSDIVAAFLVHEATHIDRYVRGEACGVFDGCEVLDNGVVLDEEIAAHAAEAQWWISIYGSGGRRVYAGYGYSLDLLAAAYQDGDDAFRAFVIAIRSDPRDGAGI